MAWLVICFQHITSKITYSIVIVMLISANNFVPCRGMALCFVMMFGRIGTVGGSNFIGAVIHGYCDVIFMVAAPCLVVAASVTYYILQKHERPSN